MPCRADIVEKRIYADVAQEVEHILGKDEVPGSSPGISSTPERGSLCLKSPDASRSGIFCIPAFGRKAPQGTDRGRGRYITEIIAVNGSPRKVATVIIANTGGSSGPVWGTLFMRCVAGAKGKTELELADVTAMLRSAIEGIQARGGAEIGDKTVLDAWHPAVVAMEEWPDPKDMPGAFQSAADAATAAIEGTRGWIAKRGRRAQHRPQLCRELLHVPRDGGLFPDASQARRRAGGAACRAGRDTCARILKTTLIPAI